jgi:hypothetical protein
MVDTYADEDWVNASADPDNGPLLWFVTVLRTIPVSVPDADASRTSCTPQELFFAATELSTVPGELSVDDTEVVPAGRVPDGSGFVVQFVELPEMVLPGVELQVVVETVSANSEVPEDRVPLPVMPELKPAVVP